MTQADVVTIEEDLDDAPPLLRSRWTVDLVRQMPHLEGERYEIIDGELLVTTQPDGRHQMTSDNINVELTLWNRQTGLGRTITAPGLVYDNDEAVAPDLVWMSRSRYAKIFGNDGKLHDSPELVIEILSPGKGNEERDRQKKIALYARHDVQEYWIVNWRTSTLDIYRLGSGILQPIATLIAGDTLESPLLPDFRCVIDRFFEF